MDEIEQHEVRDGKSETSHLKSFVESMFQLCDENMYAKTLLLSMLYQLFVVYLNKQDIYQCFLSFHAQYVFSFLFFSVLVLCFVLFYFVFSNVSHN